MPRTSRGGLVLAEQERPTGARRLVGALVIVAVIVGLGYAGYLGLSSLLTGPKSESCVATAAGQTAEVAPDQAGNAAVIAAVGHTRGLSTRAVTIAIATAMQESKLRNIRFGDRDSLGLFQQRPSQGWGTAEQILDPVYSSGAFYDRLVKVTDFETRPLTEVAQAVQRSAFPQAYAKHEEEAVALAHALTGATPAALTCDLLPAVAADSPAATIAGGSSAGAAGATTSTTLAARTKALATALQAHHGVKATTSGTTVTVTASGADAWAVASWAVANAKTYAITAVTTEQRRWYRDGAAWSTAPAQPGVQITLLG